MGRKYAGHDGAMWVVKYKLFELITSTKEVMFSPGFVCGFVCEFVCEQDNSKIYGRILMKFSGYGLKR